jgi:DNA-binding LacI/PurR family transcriptional regulator
VPRASSVSLQNTRLAADAVRLLLAHDPARPARGRTYQPVLVPRESTAAPSLS